ncbi:MAG: methyltransferase, partial [Chloroflexota bacterium]
MSTGGPVAGPVRDPGSWRDPSGFVYRRDGVVLRQIASAFAPEWEAYLASGLHARLVARGMVLPFADAPLADALDPATAWRVIRPEPLQVLSWPWEWSFGQLQAAGLLTLDLALAALDAGFVLRDASAFNIQLRGTQPVLIDSLSFARRVPDAPWTAYRQLCEHFLAPLALMAIRDVRLGRMLRSFPDGIPLDLASRLLPGRTKLRLGLATHLHLHARAQVRHGSAGAAQARAVRLPDARLRALLTNLRGTIAGLRWDPGGTEWADYADNTSYGPAATAAKERIVAQMVADTAPALAWDIGANTGRYSAIAAAAGARVVAWDIDPAAVERHQRALLAAGETRITPLLLDLADPSPALGWALRERASLTDRADADLVLALALVHHLAIGRNVPLPMIATFLAELAPAGPSRAPGSGPRGRGAG